VGAFQAHSVALCGAVVDMASYVGWAAGSVVVARA